jgi:hypothetical protein
MVEVDIVAAAVKQLCELCMTLSSNAKIVRKNFLFDSHKIRNSPFFLPTHAAERGRAAPLMRGVQAVGE